MTANLDYFSILVLGVSALCSAQASENQWRSECVGRLLVDLPGNASVAGISPAVFREELLRPSQSTPFEFPDGQRASGVRLLYRGELLISNKLDDAQKDSIGTAFAISREVVERRLAQQRTDGAGISKVEVLAGLPHGSRAWYTDSSVRLLVNIGEHLLFTRLAAAPGEPSSSEMARRFANNISYRPIFHIPAKAGLCLPHAFIGDVDPGIRNVAAMYKLVDHPDVTIYLKDSNAASYEGKVRALNAEPKRVNENFWAQYQLRDSVKHIVSIEKSDVHFSSFSGPANGFASIAQIVRKTGERDFGYIGVHRGDPARKDSVDVELVILTNADVAKSRGIVPVSKVYFLELVRRLSATLRFKEK